MEGVKAPESYRLLLVERGFVPWPAMETRPSPLTNQGPRPKVQSFTMWRFHVLLQQRGKQVRPQALTTPTLCESVSHSHGRNGALSSCPSFSTAVSFPLPLSSPSPEPVCACACFLVALDLYPMCHPNPASPRWPRSSHA
jgi:hypothetical protein